MKKFALLGLAIVAVGYSSCTKENAVSKSTKKKINSETATKKDTIYKATPLRDTIYKR